MERHARIASLFLVAAGRRPWLGGRPSRGVTLLEVMVVLVVVGILVASAMPGFGRLLSSQRAVSATNDLLHAIALARSEAMRRGRRVYLAPTAVEWHDGWAVFVDRNDNRSFDAAIDEVVTRHDALPASTTISNPSNANRRPFTDVGSPQRTYIMFDGTGYPRQRNGAFNIGSLAVADRVGSTLTVRTICLASYGRVRVVADRASCS